MFKKNVNLWAPESWRSWWYKTLCFYLPVFLCHLLRCTSVNSSVIVLNDVPSQTCCCCLFIRPDQTQTQWSPIAFILNSNSSSSSKVARHSWDLTVKARRRRRPAYCKRSPMWSGRARWWWAGCLQWSRSHRRSLLKTSLRHTSKSWWQLVGQPLGPSTNNRQSCSRASRASKRPLPGVSELIKTSFFYCLCCVLLLSYKFTHPPWRLTRDVLRLKSRSTLQRHILGQFDSRQAVFFL